MKFNLQDYETVEDRLKRARAEHPDMVVETILEPINCGASEAARWIFSCRLYKSAEDRKNGLLWSTGWANEVDGIGGPVNNASACENAETSAIGRAPANAGYSGNKRASREEMEKVQRREAVQQKLIESIGKCETRDDLTKLWNYASGNGLIRADAVQAAFKQRGGEINE